MSPYKSAETFNMHKICKLGVETENFVAILRYRQQQMRINRRKKWCGKNQLRVFSFKYSGTKRWMCNLSNKDIMSENVCEFQSCKNEAISRNLALEFNNCIIAIHPFLGTRTCEFSFFQLKMSDKCYPWTNKTKRIIEKWLFYKCLLLLKCREKKLHAIKKGNANIFKNH